MYEAEVIKQTVRDRYAGHANATAGAAADAGCCSGSSCCGGSTSESLGYSPEDLVLLPEGADLGLGCGNPHAMLDLKEGETVLDLGSGGGIDCFIAARRVGESGRVIGVDMTPEMLALARRNAASVGVDNVEFRLGEVEHLPVADGEVDVIISNCVINLVPDKHQAFREAHRVLKSGGRVSVSDIVTDGPVPDVVLESVDAYVACLSGASPIDEYLAAIEDAGFEEVTVAEQRGFALSDALAQSVIDELATHVDLTRPELEQAASAFRSVRVTARKA